VSNYVAKLASQYTKKSKIVVIKNGVDTEKLILTKSLSKFKKEINLKNEIILLSVGNLVERKGIDIVLSALPDVIKSYPSLKYFIIGAGPEKENLQKLIKGLNLRKHVVFAGDVDNKHLANFYNLCDIFVLMSRTIKEKAGIEGFGIVYIEASYFGKPVIGGKSGGTADAIVDGVTGYRIEPKNTEDLKNKLILLLKNEKLRKKLGQQGMKRVKNQFLWKHNVEKLVKVYGRLIE
jgi:phosphatidylinositol alpha-1,6-mannosyltransferase